jgi:hypothetical protein
MMKMTTKPSLLIRKEQVRVLTSNELAHAIGFDIPITTTLIPPPPPPTTHVTVRTISC